MGPDFLKVGPAAVKVKDVNSARLGNSLKCWPAAPREGQVSPLTVQSGQICPQVSANHYNAQQTNAIS